MTRGGRGRRPQAASISQGELQGMNGTMILPCSPRRGILISSPGREPGERPGTTDFLFLEPRKGRLSGVQPPLRGSQEEEEKKGNCCVWSPRPCGLG